MIPRSQLFAPGDNLRKMRKAVDSGADAVILDLEDSVAAFNKVSARSEVFQFLRDRASPTHVELWVRINPITLELGLQDLAVIVAARPDVIMLPKCESPNDLITLHTAISVLEVQASLPVGGIGVVPVVTETAKSLFAAGSYAGATQRLRALTWGAEDLSVSVGALTNRSGDNEYAPLFQLARSLCLAGSSAAGVPAIETIVANFEDTVELRKAAENASRDGFGGMMAIHPGQVSIINEAFTPPPEVAARAKSIIAAFEAVPGAATIGFEGKMLDIPHLMQAWFIMGRAASIGRRTTGPAEAKNRD